MIPNTELRIGNNVLYADKIAVVKSIQAHKVCISVNNRYIKCSYEDIFPIVLEDIDILDFDYFQKHGKETKFGIFIPNKGIQNYTFYNFLKATNELNQFLDLSKVHKVQNMFTQIVGSEININTENGSERTN